MLLPSTSLKTVIRCSSMTETRSGQQHCRALDIAGLTVLVEMWTAPGARMVDKPRGPSATAQARRHREGKSRPRRRRQDRRVVRQRRVAEEHALMTRVMSLPRSSATRTSREPERSSCSRLGRARLVGPRSARGSRCGSERRSLRRDMVDRHSCNRYPPRDPNATSEIAIGGARPAQPRSFLDRIR